LGSDIIVEFIPPLVCNIICTLHTVLLYIGLLAPARARAIYPGGFVEPLDDELGDEALPLYETAGN
jgi:hypothetical protein